MFGRQEIGWNIAEFSLNNSKLMFLIISDLTWKTTTELDCFWSRGAAKLFKNYIKNIKIFTVKSSKTWLTGDMY